MLEFRPGQRWFSSAEPELGHLVAVDQDFALGLIDAHVRDGREGELAALRRFAHDLLRVVQQLDVIVGGRVRVGGIGVLVRVEEAVRVAVHVRRPARR